MSRATRSTSSTGPRSPSPTPRRRSPTPTSSPSSSSAWPRSRRPSASRAGTSPRRSGGHRWQRLARVVGRRRAGRRDRQRPGRRAVRRRRRGGRAGVRLAARPRRVRDQGGLRRRGRPGPGPRPLPPLVRRGPRCARRHRARPVDEHHRGLARRLPGRRQQAPRRRDRAGSPAYVAAAHGPELRREWPTTYRIAAIPRRRGRARGRRRGATGPRRRRPPASASSSTGRGRRRRRGHRRPRRRDPGRRRRGLPDADAILLGAVGGPRWDDPNAAVRPEQALFALRGGLELFANLRPVRVHPALVPASPASARAARGCRPASSSASSPRGLYFGRPSEERMTPDGRVAVDTLWYTEAEIRRVVTPRVRARPRPAARAPHQRRQGQRPRHVAALAQGRRGGARRLPRRRGRAPARRLLRDAAHSPAGGVRRARHREPVRRHPLRRGGRPRRLPRDAAIGVARRTADRHGRFGLYEPIHGSAPDIAGRDLANPLGTILLGGDAPPLVAGAEAAAPRRSRPPSGETLDDGYRTRDLLPPGTDAGGLRASARRPWPRR